MFRPLTPGSLTSPHLTSTHDAHRYEHKIKSVPSNTKNAFLSTESFNIKKNILHLFKEVSYMYIINVQYTQIILRLRKRIANDNSIYVFKWAEMATCIFNWFQIWK